MTAGRQDKSAKNKIILVVEDDVFLVNAYQIKFQKEGIEVWVASDGKEALGFLEKEPPAVILLDLMLPGINGFEVLAAIRQNERWKKTPVIVLSNLGQSEDVEKARALGIDDYIVKANSKIGEVTEKIKRYF